MCAHTLADDSGRIVTPAKLQIDPSQVDNYKAALKEGVETALRVETGVLTLYPVAEKNNPTHFTIPEVYDAQSGFDSFL